MAAARVSSSRATASERLVLIPAVDKRNTTGYKNVTYNRSKEKFVAKVQDGGKCVVLGSFDTAEEAATAYARSKYGRADAAKLRQPRPAPTAAGAEAIRQAESEGLTLATSSSSSSGYKGVTYYPKEKGSKKYTLKVTVGGKMATLGYFATAEQAALFYARREAGRDTSDLTAPLPPPPPPAPSSAAGAEAVRRAEREGLTLATSSSNTGYKGVYHCPKERGSKKYKLQLTVDGNSLHLGHFATAEEAALFYARRQAGRLAGSGALEGAESETETEEEEEEEGEEPAVHRPAAPRPSGAASKRRSPGQASAAGPSRVSQQPDPDAVFGAPPPPQVLARRPSRAALLPPPDLSLPPPPPSSLQAPPPRITFDEKVQFIRAQMKFAEDWIDYKVIVEAERRLWIDPCGNLGARAHAAYIALL